MNSGFITQMKDKNGDRWYHQIILENKDKEIERLKEDIRVFKFTIKTQQEQIQELIAREDKTIEYIEENTERALVNGESQLLIDQEDIPKLLDILKGSDKE